MYNDYENVPVGNLVIISTDVDEEINGRYYLRVDTPEHFSLKGDLSGAQGIQGPQGPQGIQGPQGPQGIQGPTGPIGNGISSIEKTATSGLVDTYTITYTNGNTTTFNVSNGNGIDRIEKTDTVGNVDTYTIYFTNGETTTYEVENGEVTKEELQEEVDRLNMVYNALPSTTGEAEEISIDGTAEVPFRKIDLKGNTSQETTTGKNLFNVNSVTSVTNGTISDEIITTNETSNSTYSVFPYFSNISLPANTYYLSMDIRIKSGTGNFNKINDAATEWTAVSNPSLSTTFQRYVYSHTYTSVTTLNHILIQFISSTNAVYEIKNIMISTSSDTSYEPYTNGASPNPDYPQDIQVVSGDNTIKVEGKNLFNKNDKTLGYRLSTNGDLTSNVASDMYVSNFIKVKENTQYVKNSPTADAYHRVCFYTNNNQSSFISKSENNTFTTPVNCNYIRFCGYQSELDTTQFERGDTSTTYEPYQSASYPINLGNIELCKIGDYQDKIYKDNGKWYLNKQIGKVVLDGSENWSAFASVNYEYQLSLFAGLSTDTSNQYFPALCNKYINHNVAGSSLSNYEFSHFSTQPSTVKERFVRFRNNDITTLANWKTELQTNNAILYVPLATPTTTEITDTTLISQLEAIKNAYSYDTQTNISQTNQDKPFIISYEAILSLKNILNSLETRIAVLETE